GRPLEAGDLLPRSLPSRVVLGGVRLRSGVKVGDKRGEVSARSHVGRFRTRWRYPPCDDLLREFTFANNPEGKTWRVSGLRFSWRSAPNRRPEAGFLHSPGGPHEQRADR